ncbi:MAG: EcsC family protein [Agriterribacter sp.]
MNYKDHTLQELNNWKQKMLADPTVFERYSKRFQNKINEIIPEKIHEAVTVAIKQMIRGVLFGAEITTTPFEKDVSLQVRDALAAEKVSWYQKTAAAEGGLTGAGGILLGLADFPLLLGIKIKLLFELATLFGYDIKDYKERLYLLYIFQLAFSSPFHRKAIFTKMMDWDEQCKDLPEDINQFDWRKLQQEYRDYIDIAKMAQLVPVIGAPIGAIVNYQLIKKLGITARNAYKMRSLKTTELKSINHN